MDAKVKTKKTILYTFIEVFLILVMSIVGNMWDWVNMRFDPSAIATGKFWQEAIIKATLYSCALMVAIISKMSKQELKDARYDELYTEYRDRLPYKEANVDAFSTYIDRYKNPAIKKEYIRTKLNAKLAKIQKFEKDSWVNDYFHAKDSGQLNDYNFVSRWSKNYFIKRTRIEVMLQGDFIDKNYEAMHVKYPRLNTTSFGYYLDIKRNRDNKYKVNNEAAKDISRRGGFQAAKTIMMAFILALVALQPSTNELLEQANGWVVLLIKYIVRAVMIIFSFGTGIWTAKQIFMDNYLLPLTNRIEILDEFKRWMDINPVIVEGKEAIKQGIEEKLRKEYEAKLLKASEEYKKKLLNEYEQLNQEQIKGAA